MTRKSKRVMLIAASGVMLSLGVALILSAMRDSIVFFHSPSEIKAGVAPHGARLRIGGMVERGSVQKSTEGLDVRFRVTDNATNVAVTYRGILPDLFREGQGVIVEGYWKNDVFIATTVLTKHDETYMPREVANILKPEARAAK